MWQSVSPALYKQIRAEGVLTLPDDKYVKRLSSAITVDFDLSEATVAYLKARKEKLTRKDLSVNLIMDEVTAEKAADYLNGRFLGIESGGLTKTLLCVMIKSVAGNYEDVVAMSPIENISAEKILEVWKNVVKKCTEMGFNIVATTTDGHKANMKMPV